MKAQTASLLHLSEIGSHGGSQCPMLASDADDGRFVVTATHLALHVSALRYNVLERRNPEKWWHRK
jgi:hypothetical protein